MDNNSQIDSVVDELIELAPETAEYESQFHWHEKSLGIIYAELFVVAEGKTDKAKDAWVKSSPLYIKQVDIIAEVENEFKTAANRTRALQSKVSVWQSNLKAFPNL